MPGQGFSLGAVGSGTASGAADALEQILMQRKAEELLAQKQRMEEQRTALDARQVGVQEGSLGLNREKFAADVAAGEAEAQGKAAAAQREQSILDGILNDPAYDDYLKKAIRAKQAGLNVSINGDDLVAPDVRRGQAIADNATKFGYDQQLEQLRQSGQTQRNNADIASRERVANDRQDGPPPLSSVNSLNAAYMRNTKGAQTVIEASRNLDAAMTALQGGNMNAASQAILIGFQKILDPTSVVRESEYARGQDGQALLSRIQGAQQRLLSGGQGVTPQELQQYVDLAQSFAQGYKAQAEAEKGRIGRVADTYRIPRELVFVDDTASTSSAPPSPTDSTAATTGAPNAPRRLRYDSATRSFR